MSLHRTSLSLLFCLGVIACKDGVVNLDDTGTDTGAEADADADTDSDTDTDADTDSDADADMETLTFELTGETTGTALSLTRWDLYSESNPFPETWASVSVTGALQAIDVRPPDESTLIEIDPQNYPGMYAGYYLPALHQDDDGDGEHTRGEVFVGSGPAAVIWLDGDIPAELLQYGLGRGWNALNTSDEGGVYSIDAIPQGTNLEYNDSASLSGTYSGELALESLRLAVVPPAIFEGQQVSSLLMDEALSESWSIEVSGAPPDDHLGAEDFEGAIEVPITYVDADGSGDISQADSLAYLACSGASPAALLWFPPADTFDLAFNYAQNGFPSGWLAATFVDDAFSPLTAEQTSDLLISSDCSFE